MQKLSCQKLFFIIFFISKFFSMSLDKENVENGKVKQKAKLANSNLKVDDSAKTKNETKSNKRKSDEPDKIKPAKKLKTNNKCEAVKDDEDKCEMEDKVIFSFILLV